jgi:signal transduction histidine kinase
MVAASVDRLIPTNPLQAQQVARSLHTGIRNATGEIRRVAHDLRPPALDELGLVEALRQRISHYGEAETGPAIRLHVSGELDSLPAAVEVAAYRIVQEALMNVVRHSGARSCNVRLVMLERQRTLEVEICDDGVGISTGSSVSSGIGLRSMRERAEEVGGDCAIERIDSVAGGTRVIARMPIDGSR